MRFNVKDFLVAFCHFAPILLSSLLLQGGDNPLQASDKCELWNKSISICCSNTNIICVAFEGRVIIQNKHASGIYSQNAEIRNDHKYEACHIYPVHSFKLLINPSDKIWSHTDTHNFLSLYIAKDIHLLVKFVLQGPQPVEYTPEKKNL